MSSDTPDKLLEAFADLPAHDLDAVRGARVRGLAHEALALGQRRRARHRWLSERGRASGAWLRLGEPAMVAMVALIYLGWAFSAVNRLLG